jgi:hypothetical protein
MNFENRVEKVMDQVNELKQHVASALDSICSQVGLLAFEEITCAVGENGLVESIPMAAPLAAELQTPGLVEDLEGGS